VERPQAWQAKEAPLARASPCYVHLAKDEETLEIRAVGVTTSNVGDAPMLPDLLDQIPPDQEIATVTAPSGQHPADAPAGQWTGHMTRADATM